MAGFIEEVIDHFTNTEIFLHDVTSKWQAAIYSSMVLKLQSQTLILVVDYSMNVSHLTKKRLQAHWWAHQQSTLFPVVAYFLDVSLLVFKQCTGLFSLCYVIFCFYDNYTFQKHDEDATSTKLWLKEYTFFRMT